MAWKSYREESKAVNWGSSIGNLTINQINCGSLLRIADAAEKMASNYTALQNEVKYLKEARAVLENRKNHLERSNAALRGHIKRFKKRNK